MDLIVTSSQTASRPFISKSLRLLHAILSRAYITTPPPGRSNRSVLNGGKTLTSDISLSVVLGFSQLSEYIAISKESVSALIRSSFGSKLWILRCNMLRWFDKSSRESKLEKLPSV